MTDSLKGNPRRQDLGWGQSKLTFAPGQTKPRQERTNLQPWKAVAIYSTDPLHHEQDDDTIQIFIDGKIILVKTASSFILDLWQDGQMEGFMSKCFRSAGSGCDSIWWNIAWFPLKGCIPLPTLLKLEPKTKSLCFCQKALTDFSCSPQLFCLRPFYDVAILVLLMAVTF